MGNLKEAKVPSSPKGKLGRVPSQDLNTWIFQKSIFWWIFLFEWIWLISISLSWWMVQRRYWCPENFDVIAHIQYKSYNFPFTVKPVVSSRSSACSNLPQWLMERQTQILISILISLVIISVIVAPILLTRKRQSNTGMKIYFC